MNRKEEIEEMREKLDYANFEVTLNPSDFEKYKKIGILPEKYFELCGNTIIFKFDSYYEYTDLYFLGKNKIYYNIQWNTCTEEEILFLKQILKDKVPKNKMLLMEIAGEIEKYKEWCEETNENFGTEFMVRCGRIMGEEMLLKIEEMINKCEKEGE